MNPKCIIVSLNKETSDELERRYNELIKEYGWFRRLWWKITRKDKPEFVNPDRAARLKGSPLPTIPDNCMFFPY